MQETILEEQNKMFEKLKIVMFKRHQLKEEEKYKNSKNKDQKKRRGKQGFGRTKKRF